MMQYREQEEGRGVVDPLLWFCLTYGSEALLEIFSDGYEHLWIG
jgi:hypothetical protein